MVVTASKSEKMLHLPATFAPPASCCDLVAKECMIVEYQDIVIMAKNLKSFKFTNKADKALRSFGTASLSWRCC